MKAVNINALCYQIKQDCLQDKNKNLNHREHKMTIHFQILLRQKKDLSFSSQTDLSSKWTKNNVKLPLKKSTTTLAKNQN